MGRLIYGMPDKNFIIARCFDSGRGLKECFEELVQIGFAPLNFCGYMMKYAYKKMKKAEGFVKMSTYKEHLNKLKPLSKIPDEYIERLKSRYSIQRICMESSEIDRDLTMVLIENDDITAIMYVSRCGEKDFDAPIAFINEKARYELAVPFLITAVALRIEELYGEDFNMLLCPSFEKGHDGFRSLFGAPESETRVHDYSIAFRDENDAKMITEKLDSLHFTFEGGDDFMELYYDQPEMSWISVASALRIPYVTDMRKMSREKLAYTRKELERWLSMWDIPIEHYWKKIVFDCGKTGGTINSLSVGRIYNTECAKLLEGIRITRKLPEYAPVDYTKEPIKMCVLPDDEESLYEVLPEHLKIRMFERDFLVVAAYTQEKEVIGITVTDTLNEILNGGGIAYIRYAFVIPGKGSQEVHRRMLELTAQLAYESGCKAVYIKSFADSDKIGLYDINEPIVKYTREAEYSEARIVTFSIRQLVESKILSSIDAAKLNLPKVVYPEQPDPAALKEFAKRAFRQGYYFNPESYDAEYTAFVYDGWKIIGAIFAEQVSARELAIRDIYVEEKSWEENFRFALFSSVLQKAAKSLPDDAVLIMRMDNKVHLEAIEKMVGPAITDNVLHESFRIFERDAFDTALDVKEYETPQELSVERCFVGKLMASLMLYEGGTKLDYICAMLLDTSSQYPCREICRYICTAYVEYCNELEEELDEDDIDDEYDIDDDDEDGYDDDDDDTDFDDDDDDDTDEDDNE